MRRLARLTIQFFQVLWPTALITTMVLPALPPGLGGTLSRDLQKALQRMNLSQRWGMYSPNSPRTIHYLRITAEYADRRAQPFEETVRIDSQLDQTRGAWWWNRNRMDIMLQHLDNYSPKKPYSKQRRWTLWGMCAREKKRGEMPTQIVAERITVKLRPPEAVLRGQADSFTSEVKVIDRVRCSHPFVQKMLHETS